jgi:hypothetical protein
MGDVPEGALTGLKVKLLHWESSAHKAMDGRNRVSMMN